MVRLDMSEYMEKHTVARLIGAPPGYVGYDEGGQLTEAVRRRPYSVVLFDEIEKAHPDVFNVLLQVLDDGRLTDGQGRTVDFRNTVVIMTSNIGSQVIQELPRGGARAHARAGPARAQGALPARVPQPRRRGARVPPPRPRAHARDRRDPARAPQRAARRPPHPRSRPTTPRSSCSPREGYDPDFGARPLKRTIQRLVQDPLARMVLAGEVADGDTVRLEADGGALRVVPVATGSGVA